MTTKLVLNYYVYFKYFFCKIYVSVILQLSGMKLSIHDHSTEKKNSSNFCFKYNQSHLKLER